MDGSMPGFSVPHHLPEFAQVHVHCISDTIHPSHPITFFFCLQSFLASGSFPMSWLFTSGDKIIGASASASALQVSILGCFLRIDWFDLLAVQGILKSLLQHHSLKASILQRSAFFMSNSHNCL